MIIPLKIRFAAHYRMIKRNAQGFILEDRIFPNLIVNQGLNALGTSGIRNGYIRVGRSNQVPVVTDTQLVDEVAAVLRDSDGNTIPAGQTGEPYYGRYRLSAIFPVGTFAQAENLQEIAVSPTSSPTLLFSRALISDAQGTPTPISIQPDEQLDVNWYVDMYAPPAPYPTYQFNTNGTDYTVETRPSNVSAADNWGYDGRAAAFGIDPEGGSVQTRLYGGGTGIGPVTGAPNFSYSENADNTVNDAYVDQSNEKTASSTWGPAKMDPPGTLYNSGLVATSLGVFQFGISPAVSKTEFQQLAIDWRISWDRYTPP